MKSPFKLLVITAALVLQSFVGFATHIAGGEIVYECINDSTYIINMNLYGDCGGTQGLFGNTELIAVLNPCGTNFTFALPLLNIGGTEISPLCADSLTNSECNGGSLPGILEYNYSDTVTIGAPCANITLRYQEPNRNIGAINIFNSGGNRFYVEASLNTLTAPCNNSPEFNAKPIPYSCINQQVKYNYAVTDVEGDSLVYSFAQANGFSSGNILTGTPTNLIYTLGHSITNPIPGISLNTSTGELIFTGTQAGFYIVDVIVDQYSGGTLIGTVERDIQFYVVACSNNVPTPPGTLVNFVPSTNPPATQSGLQVTANWLEAFCADIQFTDSDNGDSVFLDTASLQAFPGATITFSPGNPATATFCWSPPIGTAAGTYSFTIEAEDDACPITGENSVTISVVVPPPNPLAAVATNTDVSCNGADDGTATVTITNGVGPYTYAWSGTGTGQGTANYTDLAPGTYSVLVTDVGAGTSILISGISITEPAPIFFTIQSTTEVSCDSACDGGISKQVVGGVSPLTFNWNNGQTGGALSNLCGGSYTVTITDANGCTIDDVTTLVEPPIIVTEVDSISDVTCFGGNDGFAMVSGYGGQSASLSTLSYRIDQTGTFAPYGIGISPSHATALNLLDDQESTAQPIGFSFEFFGNTYTTFSISSNGYISFPPFGNIGVAGCCSGESIPSNANPLWNDLIAFAWEDLNPQLGGTIEYYTDGTAPNRVLVVNFIDVPHAFSVSDLVTAQVVLYESTNIIQIHTTEMTSDGGNHTMGIENSTGTVAFAVPGRNSADWSVTNDYVAFIPDSATFTYAWPGGGTGQSQNTLTAGTYCVTVTDNSGNGCNDTVCLTINQPPPLTATTAVVNNPTCPTLNDGSASVSGSGGSTPYTFNWSTGDTGSPITGLTAGTYTVTMTDANGCTDTETVTLTISIPVASTTVVQNVSCNGGSDGEASASATGGSTPYVFNWSNGVNNSQTITGLVAGTYTVTVTDANNCTDTETVTITEPAVLVASTAVDQDVSCFGGNDGEASASAVGGTTPYDFDWSNGVNNTQTITGLTAGTYTVTVTDANNCTDTETVTITEPLTAVSVTIPTSTNVSCNGGNTGSAMATGAGGTTPYDFDWSNGVNNNQSITGLTAGTYTVTITDGNGCTDTESIIITEPGAIVITTTPTPVSCNGGNDGAATASAVGGTTPYDFDWSNGVNNTQTITGLTAGTYTVTVTDGNGCTNTATAIVTEPNAVVASTTVDQDVSCNGGNDGEASASAVGGSTPYDFDWSNGINNSQSITGLVAGTYTVTVTDANGCTDTETVTISEPAALVASTTVDQDVSCFGGNDGEASASAVGGSTPYDFDWSNGVNNTQTITGLTAGTYTVTVTDDNGCTDTETVTITQPLTGVSVSIPTSTNVSCNGGNTGSATATGTGGSTPYDFDWSNGVNNNQSITGLTAGTYTVTLTDANGCTDTESIIITEPGAIVITTTPTPASCNGGNDGAATASAVGGTTPYDFDWSNGVNNTQTITGLTAGTYTVTVTDGNGCTNTATAIVTEPNAVVASTTVDQDVSCNGGNDGEASASAVGGSTPYDFDWSNGINNSQSITGLVAGTYTVTVTDANGCTDTETVTISEPAALVASTTVDQDVSCFGGNDGEASASAVGGSTPYDFDWSNGVNNTQTITGLTAGTYTVTVTDDNGCTDTETVTITQPLTAVSVSIPTSSNVTCNGDSDGSATATGTGGSTPYDFDWSNGVNNNQSITGLTAGTYTVTLTDANGCTDTESIVITEPTAVDPSITIDNAVTCFGNNDGELSATSIGGTGPYTFDWSNGVNNSNSITGLTAGTYTVTATDDNGCTGTETIILTAPVVIAAAINTSTDVSCNGGNDGSATASATGGTTPYDFDWSNGVNNNQSITGLTAGTYTVTITDNNGCQDTASIVITEPLTAVVASTVVDSNASCGGAADGGATASATGGTGAHTFDWSTGSTNTSITGLTAGTYTVTVTDNNGCTDVETVTITEPNPVVPTAVADNNVSCNGLADGQASATATGGTTPYTFNWSNGMTGSPITGLTAGTYTLTATDANGCTGTTTVTITEPPALVVTPAIDNNVSCNGLADGQASVTGAGGTTPHTFNWSNGMSGSPITGLTAGTYVVTLTDANGCTDVDSVTITEPGAITVTTAVVNNVSCLGGNDGSASVTAAGGTTPYTFDWSNGASGSPVTGLTAGTYTVTATDANGCTSTGTVVITEPLTGVVASITSSSNVNCNGGSDGSVTAGAVGGSTPYTFDWSNGGSGLTINGLTAGTYTVTVTDANGCTSTASTTITEPPSGVTASTSVVADVSCNGGSDGEASASATGGTSPYTFNWSNGAFGMTINGLTAGTYTVTATDAGGCTDTETVTITEPLPVTVTTTVVNNVTCNGGSDGEASASATGGTTPYTFAWSTGGTGNSISGLIAGTYTVTVTDANGCTGTNTVTITEPAPITNVFTNITGSGCGVCDGIAQANPSGGNGGPYTFLWNTGVTDSIDTTLCAGLDSVTITDALGCTAVFTVPIVNIGADTVTATSTAASCFGLCDGTVTATYTCTSNPCTVEWTNVGTGTVVGTTDVVTGLCAGQYAVELTNGSGCISIDTVTITEPAAITAGLVATDVSCNGACDGSVNATISGGTLPYSFFWSTGGGGSTNSGLVGLTPVCAGTYTITISDANNCVVEDSIVVNEPAEIIPNESITNTNCNGGSDGAISLAPTGGAGPYNYNWAPTPQFGQGTSSIGGLTAGDWMVTITDDNNCTKLDTFTVIEPIAITVDTVDTNSSTCGLCDGSATITAVGGTGTLNYVWSTGDIGQTASNLCPGIYFVTVTDGNGCTEEFVVPISDIGSPDITVTQQDASCPGVCDGFAAVTINTGTPPFFTLWSTGDITDTISNLCADLYSVAVIDLTGCIAFDTAIIEEPPVLNVTFDFSFITCSGGGCDGGLKVNPPQNGGPYTYLWSTGDTTDSIGNLCVGTYIVTVTGNNGCSVIDTAQLFPPGGVTITAASTDVSCNGSCDGTATLTVVEAINPYNILWSTGDTTASVTGLCAGTYTVSLIDGNQCGDTLTVIINEPPAITITVDAMTEPACGAADGSITISATGGTPFTSGPAYGYQWLDNSFNQLIPNQTTTTATLLAAGIYNIVVTDSIGCSDTLAVTLNNLNAPSIVLDSITHVSCNGLCDGAIDVTVSGGTGPLTYAWTSGAITEDVFGLCAGNDTIAVSDSLGCLAFDFYTVNEPPALLASFNVTDVVCGSACDGAIGAVISGGSAPYTFAWSNGAITDSISNLCAGTYTLTITDSNGCTVIDSAVVGGSAPMAITVDSTQNSSCSSINDGFIAISVTGGAAPYTYNWNGPNGTITGVQDLFNILSGTYILEVTDTNGCIELDTITINADIEVTVEAMPDTIICPSLDSFLVTAVVSGATQVQWFDIMGILQDTGAAAFVNDPDTGINTYIVVASNGLCIATDTLVITETTGPAVSSGPDEEIVEGSSVVIGGSPTAPAGATIIWSPSIGLSSTTDPNPTASPLQTTTYTVSVTGVDGCIGLGFVTVEVTPLLDPTDGFSPNGDGINENWVIDFIENYPNAVVEIYNRWGTLLFQSQGYNTPWDGKYEGNDLPAGTYYYVIDLKDPNVSEHITGPVTILR